ncbi:E3 ubiquitin-protein ligase RING1-like [Momordica charantia]|uniref:E3 ubiquitin-protein ligase RING1-like n=1 Tax=Momordica charantia TaxID=3673 RepID=A0A6J1DVB5_MOMCH|nr:E3 ubiquitin-protein ligase RING1-like [Momordica charantia]
MSSSASVPSTSSFHGVSQTLFGLPQYYEYLGVASMFMVFVICLFAVRWCNRRSHRPEAEALPVKDREQEMVVRVQASDFSFGGGGDDDDECAICLGEFEEGEKCRKMSECGHIFHRNCIDRWLRVERHCPLCRGCVCIVVHDANTVVPSTPH